MIAISAIPHEFHNHESTAHVNATKTPAAVQKGTRNEACCLSELVGITDCVPNGTYVGIPDWQDTGMPKSDVKVTARRKHGSYRPAVLPDAIEGQMAEICRDLAIQTKRMRQLQEQADELRTVIGQWASASNADSSSEPAIRGGRR